MDVFSTGVLTGIVEELEQPSSFLLDLFFPDAQSEDSEEIHFDIDQSKARITPFVAPIRAGRVVDQEGFKTGTFKPAYAKDKRIFDPDRPLKRLRTGKVTVSGDGYPTTVVDYGRDAALTVTLTSTARWNDSAPTPLNDIEDWADLVMQKSGGVMTDVVMDTDAWQNFRDKTEVKDLLDTRRGSRSQAELGPRAARKARYGGAIGDFDIWIYNDRYVDDNDTEQLFLPSGTVILSGPALEGIRAYGAIRDEKAQYAALRYFIKSWLEEDPAVRFLLLQSAPLVVPYRVNASLCATVL
jgi:hypothetical protein